MEELIGYSMLVVVTVLLVITAVILLHLNMNGNHACNLILEERNLNGIELMLISCACF